MKKCAAAILFLSLGVAPGFGIQKPAEWVTYTSSEGRYSVSLPAQPKLSTQEAATADGQKFRQYLASVVEPGDVAFLVGYFDSVPGTVFSADAARDGMLKEIDGTLISETAISLGGYPGRALKVVAKPAPAPPAPGEAPAKAVDYIVHARFYEVDRRVYVLQIIFPKALEDDALAAKVTRYFDSFQVAKK